MQVFETGNDWQFLDVRSPEDFEKGHVKGAVNVPVGKLMNMDSKTMKTADEIKSVLEEAGVDVTKDISLSCAGGVAATVAFGSLKGIAEG